MRNFLAAVLSVIAVGVVLASNPIRHMFQGNVEDKPWRILRKRLVGQLLCLFQQRLESPGDPVEFIQDDRDTGVRPEDSCEKGRNQL